MHSQKNQQNLTTNILINRSTISLSLSRHIMMKAWYSSHYRKNSSFKQRSITEHRIVFITAALVYSLSFLISSDLKSTLKERIFLTSVGVSLQVRGPEFGPQ